VPRHRVHGAPDPGFSDPVRLSKSPMSWSSRSSMEWDGCDPFCHRWDTQEQFCHYIARIASDMLDAEEVDDPLG